MKTRGPAEPLGQDFDGVRCGGGESQVPGASQDHRSMGIIEGAHAFSTLRDNRRGRDPLKGHAPFLTDCPQPVKKHFIFNWIEPSDIGDRHLLILPSIGTQLRSLRLYFSQ
jgi:hypothetical protein